MTRKKGVVWISAVLYILITTVAIVIVLEVGLPLLTNLRDKTAYVRTEEFMLSLDSQIQDIAGEGEGSQRLVPVDVRYGDIIVGESGILWEMETGSPLIEPRTRVDKGNLVISSNAEVIAYDNLNDIVMENSRILVNITKVGSLSSWAAVNTSQLLRYIMFKDSGTSTNGTFSFSLAGLASSGNGYTYLEQEGEYLGSAKTTAHVNSSGYEYDIVFVLESGADFVYTSAENIVVK